MAVVRNERLTSWKRSKKPNVAISLNQLRAASDRGSLFDVASKKNINCIACIISSV